MGDSAVAAPAKKVAKAKKPKTSPTHPKVSEMVNSAIKTLKERGGSSLQAIKKYVSATYKVDAEKLSPFIKKYLKSSVASGGLVQTKGKGATGSFRIGGAAASGAKPKKAVAAKPKKAAAKKSPAKKPAVKARMKTSAKKAPAKKPAAKKTPSKKPAAKKTSSKKPAAKKTPSKVTKKAKKPKASPKKAAAKKGKK